MTLTYFLYWYITTVTTYGVSVPSGLFFPGILIGCSLGHFVGNKVSTFATLEENASQTYAIVGSAAVLSGYTRLSFCLAVILMETTEEVNLFIPMIVSVLFARGLGALISRSLYKNHTLIKHMPLVSDKVKDRAKSWLARDFMIKPVVTLQMFESVGKVIEILNTTSHNGFPVVDRTNRVIGMISRNHLIILIKN